MEMHAAQDAAGRQQAASIMSMQSGLIRKRDGK